jgi:predicted O-methyltransferase YrrM
MSAIAQPTDLRQQVQSALNHDDHVRALELLREQAESTIDVELLNDMAVIAHTAGRTADAVHLLHAAQLIDPSREEIGANLRALETPAEPAAPAAPVVQVDPAAPVEREGDPDRGLWYPTGKLCVNKADRETVETFKASGATVFAELGIYRGHTTEAIASHLAGEGEIHIFDYEDTVQELAGRLRASGYDNVVCHGNSRKAMDSYNWTLMKLLEQHEEPIFDYVFIDGAHTWAVDALAFFLVDKLLRVGGHVDFDDYRWSLAISPSQNPIAFPATATMYTPEQIAVPQVAKIVDLLVKRDARYEEIVPNKIFKKLAA